MREADLERLYTKLEKPLYNVVYRRVWNPDEAHELLQETFVRLWRMRERVELATVEPLVYRIALNLAASRLRKRRIWRWVTLDAVRGVAKEEASGEERLTRSGLRARLRKAVEELPDELRHVVLLCEFSEMSYDEIAAALSIPPGTVGSRRHRALRRLREQLSDTPDERRALRESV